MHELALRSAVGSNASRIQPWIMSFPVTSIEHSIVMIPFFHPLNAPASCGKLSILIDWRALYFIPINRFFNDDICWSYPDALPSLLGMWRAAPLRTATIRTSSWWTLWPPWRRTWWAVASSRNGCGSIYFWASVLGLFRLHFGLPFWDCFGSTFGLGPSGNFFGDCPGGNPAQADIASYGGLAIGIIIGG